MAERRHIYYWKSDRTHASENTRSTAGTSMSEIATQVSSYLNRFFRQGPISIEPAHGQGNHITFVAKYAEGDYFIRLENGPEGDNYMAVESAVMSLVKEQRIPCPIIHLTDVSRTAVPFAIQVMELISARDLNEHSRNGRMDAKYMAREIGGYIAQWQAITPGNFGLFDVEAYTTSGQLVGYHAHYRDYYYLNLDKHLDYLVKKSFLTPAKQQQILTLVRNHEALLNLNKGCLVHKDLAFWNILGDDQRINAFIDWADAISGDPVDDLSLLACFHPGDIVLSAIGGYAQLRPLPEHFEKRFWLHLLRNMIFKAVIRVRGNYFDMPGDFFMNNGNTNNLKRFTLARIDSACEGLSDNKEISDL